MKKIYMFIAVFSVSTTMFSQAWLSPKYDSLTLNQISAPVSNSAGLPPFPLKYYAPKGSNSSPLCGASMWIGGYSNGALHMAAMTYNQGKDYWPGPIDTSGTPLDTNAIKPFTNVWKIERFDIANYIYNWNAGNVQNGSFTVPGSILNWPAHGTGGYSRRLAPFVDVNNNGVYDPINDGDYPKMKGDEMIWWVFNDSAALHGETGTLALGVEVHASAYAYTCPGLTDSTLVLNNTIFYNYDIINRSSRQYDSCTIGLWMDTDLGNFADDYIGCDVMNNFGYVYNGDNYDEDAVGSKGYHDKLPFFSCNMLSGPLADAGDALDNNNDGYIDEPNEQCLMTKFSYYTNTGSAQTGNPATAIQYFNLMTGKWTDGSPITYGANGTVATNSRCRHLFPGNTDPYGISLGGSIANPVTPTGSFGTTGWTEGQAGIVKNDMRFLIGMGPFTMQPGEHNNVDYALVYTPTNSNDHLAGLPIAQQNSKIIKNWFQTDSFPSCLSLAGVGIKNNAQAQFDVKVYPNPANNYVYVEFTDANEKVTLEVFDMLGNLVKAGTFIEQRKYIALPIDELRSGMYSIRIRSGNYLSVKRFVKE